MLLRSCIVIEVSVRWQMGDCVFFFQAEDGIRDLVRSRGLGDVYKRQDPNFMGVTTALTLPGFVQSSLKGEAVCIPTAVHEFSADNSEYSVFPNPSNGNFQLTPEAINRFSEMDILDLRGRVIRNYRLTNQSNDFTFGEDLSQGMYLLQLRSDEGVVSIPLNKM